MLSKIVPPFYITFKPRYALDLVKCEVGFQTGQLTVKEYVICQTEAQVSQN